MEEVPGWQLKKDIMTGIILADGSVHKSSPFADLPKDHWIFAEVHLKAPLLFAFDPEGGIPEELYVRMIEVMQYVVKATTKNGSIAFNPDEAIKQFFAASVGWIPDTVEEVEEDLGDSTHATVEELLTQLKAARDAKDYAQEDQIEFQLHKMGVIFKESPTGIYYTIKDETGVGIGVVE